MKVIVVGASGAGLYLAYSLAREGLEVEVYERKERVDWPRRTLIVTSRLADILGFEVGEAILNRVIYMQLEAGGEKVRLRLSSPDLIIERGKFFALLAGMARREGARLYFGHELVGFYSVNGGRGKIRCLVRRKQNGEVREVEADYLVGADGALSRVKGLLLGAEGLNIWVKPGGYGASSVQGLNSSQKVNNRPEASRGSGNDVNGDQEINSGESSGEWQSRGERNFATDLKALLQWRVELKGMSERKMGCFFRFEPETCYVWFDPKRTPYFFWALPESAEVMAVGLIADSMAEAKKALASFLQEKMPEAKLLEAQAGLTPLPRFVFRFSQVLFRGGAGSWRFSCLSENYRDQAGNRAVGSLRPEDSAMNPESCAPRHFYTGKEILYSSINGGDGSGSIFLVGDAASQVKATTVGGVVAGLRGAKAVANLILGRVEEAKRELEKLRCELNLHLLLRKILNRFDEEDYRRLLSLLRRDNGLASFIARHTRDDLASFFFKLIFRYPRLAWIGLRSLL